MKPLKILIADDEPDLRKYIIHILQQQEETFEFVETKKWPRGT